MTGRIVEVASNITETSTHTDLRRPCYGLCGDTWRLWSGFGHCVAAKVRMVLRVKGAEVKFKDKDKLLRQALIQLRYSQI
jgi:hypothetical protein